MGSRLQLQTLLETLAPKAYFQPPSNWVMEYPCIVYNLDDAKTEYADNSPYRYTKQYEVTVIDGDPDSTIPDKLALLPMCRMTRRFTTANLNHTVFTLFF